VLLHAELGEQHRHVVLHHLLGNEQPLAVSAITELSGEGVVAITLLIFPITLLTWVMTCVSGWTWSSECWIVLFVFEAGGTDGEEDVRRDRYL
jgi:hypothetical protein